MDQSNFYLAIGSDQEPMQQGFDTSLPFTNAQMLPPQNLMTSAFSKHEHVTPGVHMQGVHYGSYEQPVTHMDFAQNIRHVQFVQSMAQNYCENFPYGTRTIITSDGKRKRRRIITHEQRKAANVRERRRMYHLNEAFDDLRHRVPTFAYEKKLSRIETLKLAVSYIQFMSEMLEEVDAVSGQSSPSPSVSQFSENNIQDSSSVVQDNSCKNGTNTRDCDATSRTPLPVTLDISSLTSVADIALRGSSPCELNLLNSDSLQV